MICTNCSTRNNYFHNFCYQCGAKLSSEETPLATDVRLQSIEGILLNKHRETFNPYRDKKRSRKRLLYTLVISLMSLAGIAAWAVLR